LPRARDHDERPAPASSRASLVGAAVGVVNGARRCPSPPLRSPGHSHRASNCRRSSTGKRSQPTWRWAPSRVSSPASAPWWRRCTWRPP
jgi:hypothetical protein